jgi:hypothetical protein
MFTLFTLLYMFRVDRLIVRSYRIWSAVIEIGMNSLPTTKMGFIKCRRNYYWEHFLARCTHTFVFEDVLILLCSELVHHSTFRLAMGLKTPHVFMYMKQYLGVRELCGKCYWVVLLYELYPLVCGVPLTDDEICKEFSVVGWFPGDHNV